MPLHKEVEALKLREDWKFTEKYYGHDKAALAPVHVPPPAVPYAPAEEQESEDLFEPKEPGPDEYAWGDYATEELDCMVTPAEEQAIQAAIRAAGKSVPRYLFRAWSANSGGDIRLNTVNAITPHAFLNPLNAPPKAMFDTKAITLHHLINGHLGGLPVRSPFSSWSHSLPFALSMLPSKHNAHLSIIDTLQLKAKNSIIHCGAHELGDVGIEMYGEEFLVFGVVDGAAHKAVPYENFEQYVTGMYPDYMAFYLGEMFDTHVPAAKKKKTKGRKIKDDDHTGQAKAFGGLFGPEFELPAAITLLAAQDDLLDLLNEANLHAWLMREFSVPTAWTIDTAFPSMSTTTEGYTHEAEIASKTMGALVKTLQATGRLPRTIKKGGKKTVRFAEAEEVKQTEEDQATEKVENDEQTGGSIVPGKKVHLKKTSRMPRAVYQLYIDMVGFDEHNEVVKQ